MKKYHFKIALCLFIVALSFDVSAQISRQLDIPGRLQWDNANGYCGETSIQMIALYYGSYISQNVCRTVAGGEVLIGDDNGETALNSLSFNYLEWDYSQSSPQYQNYLVWIKQQLNNYHPVIITVYVQGMSDPDYDHIIPAIGFSAANINTFQNTDELLFNNCYDSTFYTRTFQSVWDTRSMNGNGSNYEYCIPKNVDYGCAVTGIKDDQHETKPVHLSIVRWDEPNVTLGESPVLLNAVITIDSLNIGQQYALLRYNNYALIPSSGFSPSGASSAAYFTATAATKTFTDNFMSNTAVFYRCIPYNYLGNAPETFIANEFNVYPNPVKDKLTIDSPENASVEIINSLGQIVKELTLTNSKNIVDLTVLTKGLYTIRIKTDKEMTTKKFIKK